jgi:tetratricopeptide (TPR) repeat protein
MSAAVDGSRTETASAALAEAVALLASDPAKAELKAREILSLAPDDFDAGLVLATALRERGELEAACSIFARLASDRPDVWVPHHQLAELEFALGRSRAAAPPLSRALALNPGLATGWRLLGDISMINCQVEVARRADDQLLRAVAAPDPRLRAAAEALAAGRLGAAEAALRAVLASGGRNGLAAAHLLGETLERQGRLAEAEPVLARCVELAPAFDLARLALAGVLYRTGRCEAALAQLERLLARDPKHRRARMLKLAALIETSGYGEAAQVSASLLDDFPDQPQAWLFHGAALRMLGRIEESVAAYRRSLELDPDCSEAWWSLANLKTHRFSASERAGLAARLDRPGLADPDRSNLHFTLGKIGEDAGDWAEAFAHYAAGNAIERRRRAYDPTRVTALVQRSKTLFTEAFLTERAGWGVQSSTPIFIVGLPRSGSTLVDQILASHPAVEGGRELNDIQLIADSLERAPAAGGAVGYPERLRTAAREQLAGFGREYLAWIQPHRKLGRPRFTDKAPWNFLHTGLIQLILPRAKIVDVRRHPMACGFSAFKQHFAQGWEFAYDLADLGRYYADYVELMAHFDRVSPGRVHRVVYERLVADTETEVRGLLDYLELPFDPACLRFFETDRAVSTPSSEQVRRPISAEAVDHWRNFEPWLGPLRDALGPVLAAYPDAPPEA